MKVVTYNIHGGTDAARAPSLPQIAETLAETGADIFLLQEVDRFLPRSQFRDQARILADHLEASCDFSGRLRFGKAGFGNAILSRARVSETMRLPLPASGGEPRAALGIRLEGSGMAVWNTHLGLQTEWRRTQLGALAKRIEAEPLLLLGGDFNASLDAEEMQEFLSQTGLVPVSPDLPTFPNAAPKHRIDFLLARGLSASDAGTIAAPGSDHCLVWAALSLPTEAAVPPASPPAG